MLLGTLQAQFPAIKWTYDLPAPAFGSAAAADLDNDGFYEIVFTTYTNDGKAHCLNAEDGSVNWIFDIGGCGDVAPVIYDMNLDGILDVVVNGSCNPTIFCIDGATGDQIWSTPSGGGDSPPTIADIDNDGKPEVLFGNFNGEIRILNGEDGSLAQNIQADPYANTIQTEPTVVDVNNDGKLDIIAANYLNVDGLHIWAFDFATGNILWTNTVLTPTSDFHAYHGGVLADIDNDGLPEYVIGSNNGMIQAINTEDGSSLWNAVVPGSNMSALSVADLDDDGELEVIFNNSDPVTFDNRIWIVSGIDGVLEWSYPIDFSAFRGFSISDINGNGRLDLASGHFLGMLRVVEPYTGLIWEKNLKEEFTANFPYFETDHQPLIADFDQNGTLDIFAVAGYGTYIPDSLNIGRAFLLEAGPGNCPEWLMFRHDVNRTGYLSAEEVDLSCAITEVEESAFDDDINISPNPNSGEFILSYPLYSPKQITSITIHNALGQEVQRIPLPAMPNQRVVQEITLQQAPGLYFVCIDFGVHRVVKRFVLLR
ncbi:MAG: hypothetical protein DHS20C18_48880 [Saprospiraceae bacterium]|nr:MAG: hypothetical protein DHS20C18_48880 [Saprospiraceae bacterium]